MLLARYEDKVHAALARVKAMSGEQLANVIDFLGMMQMPAVNIISLAMKHSVHHRGQPTFRRPKPVWVSRDRKLEHARQRRQLQSCQAA